PTRIDRLPCTVRIAGSTPKGVWQRFATKWAIQPLSTGSTWICENGPGPECRLWRAPLPVLPARRLRWAVRHRAAIPNSVRCLSGPGTRPNIGEILGKYRPRDGYRGQGQPGT